MNDHIIVKLDHVSFTYKDSLVNDALNDVSIQIMMGEYVALLGPNGGGKTTLLKLISGLIKPTIGEISQRKDLKIGYVPQKSTIDKTFPITVIEAVLMGRIKKGIHPFFHYRETDKNDAIEIMTTLGIDKLKDRPISALSGGEFQKMLIGRALIAKPEILLLDEPTASLDQKSREEIYMLLLKLKEQGMTIILVTHDASSILHSIDHLVFLDQQLLFDGNPKDYNGEVHKHV